MMQEKLLWKENAHSKWVWTMATYMMQDVAVIIAVAKVFDQPESGYSPL
jgi:hypothetical protein